MDGIDLFGDETNLPTATHLEPFKNKIQQRAVIENPQSFTDLQISHPLQLCLKAHGITTPLEVQRLAIPPILAGKDAVVIAPTAAGKTLAFTLPMLQHLQENPVYYYALVLAPTRELAYQLNEQFSILCPVFGLYSSLFVGGTDILEQNQLLDAGFYVGICTPGRLVQILRSRPRADVEKRMKRLKMLVLDEADQFMTGSTNFNRDIEEILSFISPASERQTVLTTASYTKEMRQMVENSRFTVIQTENLMPPDVTYRFYVVPQEFYYTTYLVYFIEKLTGYQIVYDSDAQVKEPKVQNPGFNQAIVFVPTQDLAELVNRVLLKLGLKSTNLHSLLTMEQRIRNLNSFRAGTSDILVTTDVAARGLDIPAVNYEFQIGTCDSVEEFQHRAGRAGRRGKGEVMVLIDVGDAQRLKDAENQLGIKFEHAESVRDFVREGIEQKMSDEYVVRNYFAKVVRAEKEVKVEMLDQSIGWRIKRKRE